MNNPTTTWITPDGNYYEGLYVAEGSIPVPPRPSADHTWNHSTSVWEISSEILSAQKVSAAEAALESTDLVAIRCFKAGIEFPAEWQAYTQSLRDIVNGSQVALPVQPAMPDDSLSMEPK